MRSTIFALNSSSNNSDIHLIKTIPMRIFLRPKLYFYFILLCLSSCLSNAYCNNKNPDFYQIKIYQFKGKGQEARLDQYFKLAYLPALHRAGISKVGVFKPLANDTSALGRVYLLIPLTSLDQLPGLTSRLEKDDQYLKDAKDYLDAVYTDPPYLRIESILLQAFRDMPHFEAPALKNSPSDRIYELRSYEGSTEKIHENKLKMFNEGGEIPLFRSLGFNAVFYAEVLSGAHMPNLMYMTSFDDMASHDQHWKNFSGDPIWKKLSSSPEYQNNVSHIDIVLMHPAEYSDL
jgi:hypothetical protein